MTLKEFAEFIENQYNEQKIWYATDTTDWGCGSTDAYEALTDLLARYDDYISCDREWDDNDNQFIIIADNDDPIALKSYTVSEILEEAERDEDK